MFEGMLAKKYILAQKRHSALTVCSIAIALALITMMFCVFSTVIGVIRNIAYEESPYHVHVRISDNDKAAFKEEVSGVATCSETTIGLNVTFHRYIGTSLEVYLHSIGDKLGYDRLYEDSTQNQLLMFCDMVDVGSAALMVLFVALFYVFVLFLIAMLRLIIDTAFEISSKERERQFGVLQSIGATPKQIVRIITVEGLMLSVIGIPVGVGLGIGLGYALFRAVLSTGIADLYLSASRAAEIVQFTVNPWLLLLGAVTGVMWVFFSAFGTGTRVIKMSPVQAISSRSNTVKKVRRNSLFGLIFGWTGKIASRNNMRQPKRFIATVISLTMSIALFSAVTVVIDNLHGRVDEYYKDRLLNSGDFTVHPHSFGSPDPFAYKEAMEILEESKLFSEVCFFIEHYGSYNGKPYDDVWASDSAVLFYNRDKYNQIFDGKPPISYDELSKSGGYILYGTILDEGNIPKSVSLEYGNWERITEEEYNELSEEEKLFAHELINSQYYKYQYYERYRSEFDVFMTLDLETSSVCRLIGTIDLYESGEYAKFKYPDLAQGIVCILANDDNYLKALDLMQQNFRDHGFDEFTDHSTEMRQMRSTLSSVNIGAAFFSVLIALIAVVNMVNILSTGILNRRGELAAMQCVGMTEKQLYKMTVIECLQYALTSGIGAVAVCELLLFLTDKMLYLVVDILEYIGYSVNYVEPLPIIGIASLCAFIVAIAASVIPLRAMQKTSLVDQIRSVE